MNLDLDDLDLGTVAIIDAGVDSLDAGLSAATSIALLSDPLGRSLGTELTAVGAADGVVIAGRLGLVKTFKS